MNPDLSPSAEHQLQRLLSKKAAAGRIDYAWKTCRPGGPIDPYMQVSGCRVSWTGVDQYCFYHLVEQARRCRGKFRPETREWEFRDADQVRRFLNCPEVVEVRKRLTTFRDSCPPRFAAWVSECGTMAVARPLVKSCAAVSVAGCWVPNSGARGVMSCYIAEFGDGEKFAGLETEPWILDHPIAVKVRVGVSVAVVQLDPRNDPRHLLVASMLGQAGCGSQPVVLMGSAWAGVEQRVRAAGIPVDFGTKSSVVAPAQDFARVPGWAQSITGGDSLKPHQKSAVEYLGRVGTGALLGDEMGLGKTASAIAYCESITRNRIVIVAPLAAFAHWRTEIDRWGGGGEILEVRHSSIDRIPGNVRWVLVNYEQLIRRRRNRRSALHDPISMSAVTLAEWSPDQCIIDEAHRSKNPHARRSQGVAVIARKAERVLLLTGTPVRNHPREVLSLLALLSPGTLDDLTQLAEEWKTVGATTLVDIARARLSACMLRRTKGEVQPELPPVTSQCTRIGFDASEETQCLIGLVAAKLSEMASLDDKRSALRFALFAQALRFLGLAKANSPTVLNYVLERLSRGERTLVFARHVEVVTRFCARLEACGLRVACITGEMSPADRTTAADSFQNGECDVFVGTVGAAGEAITLTRANAAAMLELTWVPAELEQAGARGHRIGQTSSAYTIVYFYSDIAADLALLDCIQRKLGYTGAILGDESYLRLEDIVRSVIARLRSGALP